MMWRACTDKPHRCPVCGAVPARVWADRFRWWRVYRCDTALCRAQFTGLPRPGRRSGCRHTGACGRPCGSLIDVLYHRLVWRPVMRISEWRYRRGR